MVGKKGGGRDGEVNVSTKSGGREGRNTGGEVHGELCAVYRHLASRINQEDRLTQRLPSLLVYPSRCIDQASTSSGTSDPTDHSPKLYPLEASDINGTLGLISDYPPANRRLDETTGVVAARETQLWRRWHWGAAGGCEHHRAFGAVVPAVVPTAVPGCFLTRSCTGSCSDSYHSTSFPRNQQSDTLNFV